MSLQDQGPGQKSRPADTRSFTAKEQPKFTGGRCFDRPSVPKGGKVVNCGPDRSTRERRRRERDKYVAPNIS